MLVFLLVLGILIGLIVALAALRIQRTLPTDDYKKTLADLLLRFSVLIFGIAFGFFAFFSQRWLEDVNNQIDEASETLGNLDIIQAKYMSATENTYFLNDKTFMKLVEHCQSVIKKDEQYENYCEVSKPDSPGLTGSDLADLSDYFEFEQEKEFYSDFYDKLYEQAFLKRTISWDTIENIFETHNLLLAHHSIIVGDFDDAKQLSEQRKNEIAKLPGTTLVSDGGDTDIKTYGHDVCCDVEEIANESKKIAKIASDQAGNFCGIRKQFLSSLESQIDYVIAKLAGSRIDAISTRVESFKAGGSSCKFTPASESDD